MLKYGGLRKLGGRGQVVGGPVVGCQVLGGPVGAYLRLSGQRGSEENLEAFPLAVMNSKMSVLHWGDIKGKIAKGASDTVGERR